MEIALRPMQQLNKRGGLYARLVYVMCLVFVGWLAGRILTSCIRADDYSVGPTIKEVQIPYGMEGNVQISFELRLAVDCGWGVCGDEELQRVENVAFVNGLDNETTTDESGDTLLILLRGRKEDLQIAESELLQWIKLTHKVP